MRRVRINLRSLLQVLFAFAMFGAYWYWVNNKLINDADQAFGLTTYFLLMCVSTAFFPLPANLLTLGAVKIYDPLLVAVIGAAGTTVAYLLEYQFFGILFKFKKVANVKNTWIYKKLTPLFNRQRFFILSFLSFLPISSEPVRIYAISVKYSLVAFMLAGFVGRLPRYFLLGYYGKPYVNSIWFLAAVILFPVVFLIVMRAAVALYNFSKQLRPASVAVPPQPNLIDPE